MKFAGKCSFRVFCCETSGSRNRYQKRSPISVGLSNMLVCFQNLALLLVFLTSEFLLYFLDNNPNGHSFTVPLQPLLVAASDGRELAKVCQNLLSTVANVFVLFFPPPRMVYRMSHGLELLRSGGFLLPFSNISTCRVLLAVALLISRNIPAVGVALSDCWKLNKSLYCNRGPPCDHFSDFDNIRKNQFERSEASTNHPLVAI